MKYLLLSIFIMLSASPLQASFCDMCTDKGHSHQSMPDAGMHAGMDHGGDSGMQHGMGDGSDQQSMDCCDDEPATSDHGCSTMAHCGAGSAGPAIMSFAISPSWITTSKNRLPALSQVPPNQFSSPPFRPPIS